MNRKGGVGKTTTSYNLSYSLSEVGKRVLIVDLDTQGHSTKAFGFLEDGYKCLYDIIIDHVPFLDAVRSVNPNLDILCSNSKKLKMLEGFLSNQLNEIKFLRDKMKYDFVIFDCSPSDSNINDNALTGSDFVIIPTECQYFSQDGIVSMIDKINNIKKNYNQDLSILGLLLTKYNASIKQHKEVVDSVKSYFKDVAFNTIIRQDAKLSESPSYKKTIFEYDIRSKGSVDYIDLTKEILDRI